jgi:hypothetical protein
LATEKHLLYHESSIGCRLLEKFKLENSSVVGKRPPYLEAFKP